LQPKLDCGHRSPWRVSDMQPMLTVCKIALSAITVMSKVSSTHTEATNCHRLDNSSTARFKLSVETERIW
jgi:hypothetical protein